MLNGNSNFEDVLIETLIAEFKLKTSSEIESVSVESDILIISKDDVLNGLKLKKEYFKY